jgi:hypothetical protein
MIDERYGRSAAAQEELAATRAGLRDVLLPADDTGAFPRSATMRALTGRRGGNNAVSILVLVGIAVLATRPGVAGRLARAAPLINLLRQFGLTPR